MGLQDSNNYWSWVDASFMAMNTWARMGAATGESKYHEKQWANFQVGCVAADWAVDPTPPPPE
jgi:rhamnogalacturonyl hydrolase YesR